MNFYIESNKTNVVVEKIAYIHLVSVNISRVKQQLFQIFQIGKIPSYIPDIA